MAADAGRIIAIVGLLACGPGAPRREGPVRVERATGAIPFEEPRAEGWDAAGDREIDLVPQRTVQPMAAEGSSGRLRVRALHDGQWVAFRLEWEDRTEDAVVGTSRFSDAVAIQFPAARGQQPGPMMGHQGEGGRVQVLYWRAAWQQGDPMGALHPNRAPWFYPSQAAAEGEPRQRLERLYSPAAEVRNPTLQRFENQPAFRGEAEGFGTLSPATEPQVRARGEYAEGHWYVVLAMPIGDAARSVLAPGQSTQVAFALWDGSAGHVGARKLWSGSWLPLEVAAGGGT
ncbi:MAG: ethylbenzene dehydrogenase-related protein [Myxococcota bacterium]|nr:ethylbenzene dehydrogenase-related protein [Myxococcota bacterium]MDW8363942.1 ethylbenzene dehydrogenase-related protein [Myxococcales bacterium]